MFLLQWDDRNRRQNRGAVSDRILGQLQHPVSPDPCVVKYQLLSSEHLHLDRWMCDRFEQRIYLHSCSNIVYDVKYYLVIIQHV